MAGIVHELWCGADFVLVAAPPIAREGEVLALAALSDGALVIVQQGMTTEDTARRAVRSLEDIDVPVIGAVVTRVSRRWGLRGVGARPRRARSDGVAARAEVTPSAEGLDDRVRRNGRILAMLKAGTSQVEIAREVGITRARVGQIAKDLREQGLLDAESSRRRSGATGDNGRGARGGFRP
jgi:hypothetical protein